MNKNYLLFLLNVSSAFIIAQSAITLSNSNMPGANDTLRFTNVSLNSVGNYTQSGTNYTWNFGAVSGTGEGRRDFKAPAQTPYALYFLFSTNAYGEKALDTLIGGTGTITITDIYNFYKKQTSPNAYIADASGMNISGFPVLSSYSDKDELYNFPMTYPKYDSTTFKYATTTAGLLPIKYSKAGYRVTTVDGWGTITTPYGTENCLRLITTQYSKDTTTITLPAIGTFTLPPIKLGLNNYVRSYQWLTLTSKIPYFEVTGNLIGNNFTATSARYRGYQREIKNTTGIGSQDPSLSIQVYPNPVQNLLWISNSAASESVEVISMDGKKIIETTSNHFGAEEFIDVSDLAKGVYLLKITNENGASLVKFIKD